MWQVSVDRALCLGSGTCVNMAPDYFRMEETGRSTLVRSLLPQDPDLEDAAELCPAMAIQVRSATDDASIAPAPYNRNR